MTVSKLTVVVVAVYVLLSLYSMNQSLLEEARLREQIQQLQWQLEDANPNYEFETP